MAIQQTMTYDPLLPLEKMDDATFNEAWRVHCQYRPPRTFLMLLDVRQFRVLQSCGLSELGYHNERGFSEGQVLEAVHPNQRELLKLQTRRVYGVFARRPDLIRGKGVVYCNIRSFRDSDGVFWRVHQASVPVRYDEADILTQYLSFYRILGPYNGEPFETYIYAADAAAQQGLTEELMALKREVLLGLGFSKAQRRVIDLMVSHPSREQLAALLHVTPRTIDKHRLDILTHGRELFPANSFSTAQDVVGYLVRQGLAG